jgi:hypothetical protein
MLVLDHKCNVLRVERGDTSYGFPQQWVNLVELEEEEEVLLGDDL